MVPWEKQIFWPTIPIKLQETFILYIFHNSKLFWLRHATFNQNRIPSVKWLKLISTTVCSSVLWWILGKKACEVEWLLFIRTLKGREGAPGGAVAPIPYFWREKLVTVMT